MKPDIRKPAVFRSCLYVPGHQPDRIERAYASDADAIILDLEDAVPAWEKNRARQIVASYTTQPTVKPTYVRVNAIGTGRCLDDVAAVAGIGLEGVRMAKVGHPHEVCRVASLLERAGCTATIHFLIESAHALENVYQPATASRTVRMLGLGESDLRADLRTGLEGSTMDVSRARVIIASRAAGLSQDEDIIYDTRSPVVTLRVVDPATGEPVEYGARGQVVMSYVSKVMFLPNNLERDTAIRVPAPEGHVGDSVSAPQPVETFGGEAVIEGIY